MSRLAAITCAVAAVAAATVMLGPGAPPAAAQTAPHAQAAPDTSKADGEAAEAIALLDKAVEDRNATVVQEQLRHFEDLWRSISPKMLKKVTTSVVGFFKNFKPRNDYDLPLEPTRAGDEPRVVEDTGREELLASYKLAAGVLYDKPEGREVIQQVLKIPHVRAWPEVVAILVEGLGYQPDTGLTAVIRPYLDDPSPLICGAAAKALAQLHDEPIAVRREAVGALVKAYSAALDAAEKEKRRAKPAADGETVPTPAADKLVLMEVPFGLSLQKLTRQSCTGPAAWQKWFDEHGKDANW